MLSDGRRLYGLAFFVYRPSPELAEIRSRGQHHVRCFAVRLLSCEKRVLYGCRSTVIHFSSFAAPCLALAAESTQLLKKGSASTWKRKKRGKQRFGPNEALCPFLLGCAKFGFCVDGRVPLWVAYVDM